MGKKRRGIKPKWIIIAVIVLVLISRVSPEDSNENTDTPTETLSSMLAEDTETETPTELPEEPPTESESEISTKPPKTIAGDVDINFSDNVRNDVTGNWRLARVATTKEVQEYALEYYNTYFKSDDEIHAIVNFTLNTTNGLSMINSDTLEVAVYDYVDNEEHDANILFSGTQLADYEINTSTGEIMQIMPEAGDKGKQEQAEPEAVEQPENAAPEAPADTAEAETVWLSATGSKYHSIPNCGRMDPNKARQVSKSEAEQGGFAPCDKCY